MESVGGEICGVRDWLPHDRLIRDNDWGSGRAANQNSVAINVHGLLRKAHQHNDESAGRILRLPPIFTGLERPGRFVWSGISLGQGVANCDSKVHSRQASRKNQLDLCGTPYSAGYYGTLTLRAIARQ